MPNPENSFTGQVVLVTGASRGIGRATAELFAARGAVVAVNCRSNLAGARQAVEAIQKMGGRAKVMQADVGLPADCERLVESVEDDLGPIRVLVNNAAAFQRTPFLEMSLEELKCLLSTNLQGVFYLSQLAARKMASRQAGSIVNISSILARQVIPGQSAYCATKGAIESLTRALACELAQYNIRVNAVAPGLINTEALIASFNDSDEENRVRQHIPSQRFGLPEEIARVVVFLASEDASYINGAVLAADSGFSIIESGPPQKPHLINQPPSITTIDPSR